MNHLRVSDICADTLTNAAGYALYTAVENSIAQSDLVEVSFEGTNGISSSFLNSSVGALIEKHGIEVLSQIKLVKISGTQADVLKKFVNSAKKQFA